MNFKSFLGAALLATLGTANATNYNLGSLTAPDSAEGTSAVFAKNALINDNWSFTLLAPADASALVSRTFSKTTGAIGSFSAFMSGGTLAAPVAFSLSSGSSFQNLDWAGALGTGVYNINVAGKANAANTRYSVLLDVTPVPEPETYALMLAGLAAVGFVARRRAPKA
jgi:hypothetical protein